MKYANMLSSAGMIMLIPEYISFWLDKNTLGIVYMSFCIFLCGLSLLIRGINDILNGD